MTTQVTVPPPPSEPVGEPIAPSAGTTSDRPASIGSVRADRTAEPRRRLDPRRLPAWAQALLVFAGSRVLVSYVAHRAADLAGRRGDGHRWTYWDIADNWDGTWY